MYYYDISSDIVHANLKAIGYNQEALSNHHEKAVKYLSPNGEEVPIISHTRSSSAHHYFSKGEYQKFFNPHELGILLAYTLKKDPIYTVSMLLRQNFEASVRKTYCVIKKIVKAKSFEERKLVQYSTMNEFRSSVRANTPLIFLKWITDEIFDRYPAKGMVNSCRPEEDPVSTLISALQLGIKQYESQSDLNPDSNDIKKYIIRHTLETITPKEYNYEKIFHEIMRHLKTKKKMQKMYQNWDFSIFFSKIITTMYFLRDIDDPKLRKIL
ncbi:MAG: hypothetical protein HQK54_12300 [Oligoflexales bacterium]|nr:hypothetical protein [Oligoflexales bacterium]